MSPYSHHSPLRDFFFYVRIRGIFYSFVVLFFQGFLFFMLLRTRERRIERERERTERLREILALTLYPWKVVCIVINKSNGIGTAARRALIYSSPGGGGVDDDQALD